MQRIQNHQVKEIQKIPLLCNNNTFQKQEKLIQLAFRKCDIAKKSKTLEFKF